jgi:hypothetical protein
LPAARAPARIMLTEEDMLVEVGEMAGGELELEEMKAGGASRRKGERGAVVSEGDMLALLAHSPAARLGAEADSAVAAPAAPSAAAAVAAGRRTVRASPGHLVACGHACLYGAVEATRYAAAARAHSSARAGCRARFLSLTREESGGVHKHTLISNGPSYARRASSSLSGHARASAARKPFLSYGCNGSPASPRPPAAAMFRLCDIGCVAGRQLRLGGGASGRGILCGGRGRRRRR